MDVAGWLVRLGLGQYAPSFAANDIDGAALPTLTADDLKELGVASLGHRKKLLAAIEELRPEAGSPSAPPREVPKPVMPRHLAERILRSRDSIEGERKQVTVLFADIRGSMELIEGMDPEDAKAVLDPAIEAMMRAVSRYEGTVNKVLGDGVMALFGAPLAHEDHAVRACFAALAMQAAIQQHAEEARRRHGVELQVRVGLHSGEVVVRAIGNDLTMDYDAIGATTHLAARMEQLAPPGAIRLTGVTHRLAEGFIEAEALGAVPIKGTSEPIEVFALLAASDVRSRFQASAAGGFSRFVGRENEMAALKRALASAGERRGEIVAVVGEPGVGKSRLYYEFVRSPHAKGWLVLESGSVSHGRATAWLPVVGLLRAYFGLNARDDARAVRERVVGKLLTLDESLRAFEAPLLALFDANAPDAAWLGADPAQRRRRTLSACRSLLLREAQRQPVIVVFEDLHWIDPETQALLDELADGLAGARILMLVNYRPEYQDGWTAKSYYTRLRIDPLEARSAAELLDDLLGPDLPQSALREMLIRRTEGNPFFLEESVRALIEGGALVGARGAYRLTVPVSGVAVPSTVQAVLAARIDRLEPEEKRLLQTAAVIGKDFSLPLLLAAAEMEESEAQRRLAALQAAEFVYETRLFPDPEYTFKHALTHEVAYRGLLNERRRALHARIVAALERLRPERRSEAVDRLAYHALRAEDWERALAYSREAGLRAREVNANRSALDSFSNALTALARLPASPQNTEAEIELHFAARDALFVLGGHGDIPAHLNQAEALALRMADRAKLAAAWLYISGSHWQGGAYAKALDYGRRALAAADELADRELASLARYRMGVALGMAGRARESAENLLAAVAGLDCDELRGRFRFGGLPFVFASSFASWSLAELGRFAEAEAIGRRGLAYAQEQNQGYSVSAASFGIGHCLLLNERIDDAVAALERGMEQILVHEIGATIPWVASRLAYAYAEAGLAERARPLFERATDPEVRARGTTDAWPFVWVARAHLALGETPQAAAAAQRALELCAEQEERAAQAWSRWVLAEVELRRAGPQLGPWREHVSGAERDAEELGMRPLAVLCRLSRAAAARAEGATERGRDIALGARADALALGMTRSAERAAKLAS